MTETATNPWDADWQPYDEDTDPFAGDWEATTPGTESLWQADWQPEVEEAPTFGGRVKESWETGKKQVSIGQLSFKQLLGDKAPETEQRIKAIEETIPQGPRPSRALPEQAVRAAAEMAPIPLTGMVKGLERGTALGLGFGAIATLGGPAAPITVPAAAAAGFSIGMISASLENIGGIEAGLAYREFKDLKDPETGEEMSEGIAKVAGLTVGAINGAIELLQIKTFLRSIPGAEMLVRKGLTQSVKKVLKSKALKSIAFKSLKKYGAGVAVETGQEELQEIVNISGRYMATEVNNALKGTNIPTQTKKEIIDQLLETGKQSALAFSVFMAPGSAVSTTQDMAERRKAAGPGAADLLKTEGKADKLETQLREDFNTGKINSSQLKEIQSQIPKKHPTYKVIEKLLKESEATTPETDMLTGDVIALEPEDFLPAGAIPTQEMPLVQEAEFIREFEEPPSPQEAIPGAFQPLAGIPAEESAQVFAGAGLYQDKARADQLEMERRAEAEKVSRETYDRTTRPGYEGLTEQVKEKGEAAEIEGMEFKVPYIRGLLEQVKGAEAGRRIRVTDYDGTEKWFGVPSEFPAFMKNRYSRKEVVSAIEKGLSGYVFPEHEVRQASIWEDVKSEAFQMRNRDLKLAAETYIEEPAAIEGLDDKAYKLLITELRHEGYSTREIEEIAARHRKAIESDVIASIGNEYGFSNEEIQEILDDPLEAVSDLDAAWKEATATKPVAAYLTPITEAEHYESAKERRLARPERKRETPGRAILEREAGGPEIEAGGIFQEASPDEIEQKGQLIAKLINGNLFPGHKVKYDGIWEGFAPDMPDMYQFTSYAKDSPIFKATVVVKELEADSLKEKLEDTVEKFSKAAPEKEFKEAVDLAAGEAETEPTEAQKEAGNYKKGHITLYGLDITIENPKGSIRKGIGKDGKPWETKLKHHYGYILRTEDKDGDQVDVFIGDAISSDSIFVVNQIDPGTKNFDEHKTMMGFETVEQARVAYLANYERGWKGLGNIVSLSVDEFKSWLKHGDQTKPISKADIKGHGLDFMTEHKTKAELDKIYQGQVKTLTERVGPDKQKRAEMLAEVISAYKIESKKYPAEKKVVEKVPAPKALKQILENPKATEAEVTREKAHLKSMVIEGVKSGKYKGAVRFSTVIDLKKTVEADKFYVSREGAIHATPILNKDDDAFPAYGSYKNHAVAYIIPEKYITEKPDAHTKEVLVDPDTPLDAVTFLIDGQDKEFNIIDLITTLDARPDAKDLIKQYRDEHGESEALEFFKDIKGGTGRFKWQGVVVHRSTVDPDGWRITYFDAEGFSGHSEFKTIEEAVSEAIDAGFETPEPGLLDRAAEEPGFLEGTIRVYKAQKEHAKKMAGVKKHPLIVEAFVRIGDSELWEEKVFVSETATSHEDVIKEHNLKSESITNVGMKVDGKNVWADETEVKKPKINYYKAEDLAKEGFKSWDSKEGYDTDAEASIYLKTWENRQPQVEFRLSRHEDGTLSVWGKPKVKEKPLWKMTKAEQLEKIGRPVHEHAEAISRAHKAGKTIPTEVLDDFPEISKRLGFKKKEKAPVTEAKPKQKEWQALKVGDVFYDELNKQHLRVFGKGMTKKHEAQVLADENDGMVWIDTGNKWAVVAKVEPLALTPEQVKPWAMSKDEYREFYLGEAYKADISEDGTLKGFESWKERKDDYYQTALNNAEDARELEIQDALDAGKPIPPKILKEFDYLKKEPLVLTPEQGTSWERQAELEREGVIERPAKGKKVKAVFGEKPITGAGIVGRQTGLFGLEKGETTDMFAEAEEKAKAEPVLETAQDYRDMIWGTTNEINRLQAKKDRLKKQAVKLTPYSARREQLNADAKKITDKINPLLREIVVFKEGLAKLEKKEAKVFVKTLDQVRADAKKGKKAGIDYTAQMEVAETGDIVEVTTDAGTALNEADNRLENYNKLLECIESD